MNRTIQWNLTPDELRLVWAIAGRAQQIMERHGFGGNATETAMDVAACHLNGCTLRLRDLLDADDTNFLHDIGGIAWNMDRTTGRLKNHFVPRYALDVYRIPTRVVVPFVTESENG